MEPITRVFRISNTVFSIKYNMFCIGHNNFLKEYIMYEGMYSFN